MVHLLGQNQHAIDGRRHVPQYPDYKPLRGRTIAMNKSDSYTRAQCPEDNSWR
jgi:hypothetical protein